MAAAAVALFAWLMFAITFLQRRLTGRPARVTLLPYQRGILYRRGLPAKDVGPGQQWVWSGFDKTLFLDTRPQTVSYQNQAVSLSDGSTAVYGFSATAQVNAVRKAMYSSGSFTQLPAFVLLCVARNALNRCNAMRVRTSQAEISAEIVKRAQERLGSAGFELVNFRLTQLTLVPHDQ